MRACGFFLILTLVPAWAYAGEPSWFIKTIIPGNDCIYAVGHSQLQPTEQQARDEAIANASKEFVRYCKIEVEESDTSTETYMETKRGKTASSVRLHSSNTVRTNAAVSGALPEEWFVRKEYASFRASVLLRIPKSEFERISQEQPARLSMDMLFYYEDASGKLQMLSNGSILRSGEGYALYVKPDDTCYLYVYRVNQDGKAMRIFPNKRFKTADNPLPAGTDCWIPNKTGFITLDDTTGKDYFYAFGSPRRIKEFEGDDALMISKIKMEYTVKKEQMENAMVAERKKRKAIQPKKHTDALEVKKKLLSDSAFVYETWYWHSYNK